MQRFGDRTTSCRDGVGKREARNEVEFAGKRIYIGKGKKKKIKLKEDLDVQAEDQKFV